MTASLKLVSIHNNRCAGTSLYSVLRRYYKNVMKIHTISKDNHRNELSVYGEDLLRSIGDKVDVIHGHFNAGDVKPLIGKVPIITFIREPADRVVSNYFYDIKQYNITGSILDYAEQETNRNLIHKRLDGIDLNDFYFIGEQRYIGIQLSNIGHRLGWPMTIIPHLNITHRREINDGLMNIIRLLNEKDMKVYNKVNEHLYIR